MDAPTAPVPVPLGPPASPSAPLRYDLISSALTFLSDPSVRSSPLAKRIAFLESRGLTPEEIDEAVRRSAAGMTGAVVQPYGRPQQGRYNGMGGMGGMQGQERGRDWRDWFIMTVVGGSVGYLAVALARKYLLPALSPPSTTDLDSATDALTAKYDECAALLAQLQTETAGVREVLEGQDKRVEGALEEVKEVVEEVRRREKERDEESKSIREEVENVREMIPRMMDKHRDQQSTTLSELSAEVKSLKSLLLSRPSTLPSAPTSAAAAAASRLPSYGSQLPGLANRPQGLPAWQLAGAGVGTSEKEKEKEGEKKAEGGEADGYKVDSSTTGA